jgi:hypothetical protein
VKSFAPQFFQNWKAEIKENGWKGFIKHHGWKVFAGIIVYYLIRDTLLYIVIPFLIINNIISCQ